MTRTIQMTQAIQTIHHRRVAIIAVVLLLIAVAGCGSSPDERLAEFAQQSMAEQVKQNDRLAEQSTAIVNESHQLAECYTRLRFNSGPAAEMLLETEIEFEIDFSATDPVTWELEYRTNVEFNDPFDSGLTTRSDRKPRQRVVERTGERVADLDVERDAEFVADLEAEQFEDAYLEMLTEREEAWSHDYI